MNPFLYRLSTDVPLIEIGALTAMIGEPRSAEPVDFAKYRARLKPTATIREDGIAVVPVEGALARKPSLEELTYCGVEDSGAVLKMIEDVASNPAVRGILLNIDSPGGMVTGGLEIADAVAQANRSKPVVAWVGGMAASLGYYIACQASEVVASRSAVVGSIGCVISFFNYAKMLTDAGIQQHVFTNADATVKAAGAAGMPLTEAQKAYFQDRVEKVGRDFQTAVKAARGELADAAKTGAVFFAPEARTLGLIDRIGSEPFALGVLRKEIRSRG